MKTNQGMVVMAVWLALAAGLRAEYGGIYSANLAGASVTNDFTYSQVGTIGATLGANSQLVFTNNALRFQGRYQAKPAQRLAGVSVTNSLKIDLAFKLFNTATSETFVAVGAVPDQLRPTPSALLRRPRQERHQRRMCSLCSSKWEYSPPGPESAGAIHSHPTSSINATSSPGTSPRNREDQPVR